MCIYIQCSAASAMYNISLYIYWPILRKRKRKKEKGRKKNRKKKMILAGGICSYSAGESTDVGMYPDNTLELND